MKKVKVMKRVFNEKKIMNVDILKLNQLVSIVSRESYEEYRKLLK